MDQKAIYQAMPQPSEDFLDVDSSYLTTAAASEVQACPLELSVVRASKEGW